MDAEAVSAAVATAIEKACTEDNGSVFVNVDVFAASLKDAGVPIKITDRSKLVQEVGLLRDEITSARAKAFNAKGTEAEDELEVRAEFLLAQERQLIAQLWPGGMPQ
jgi:hypothetical protein